MLDHHFGMSKFKHPPRWRNPCLNHRQQKARLFRPCFAYALILLTSSAAQADELFKDKIEPILQKRCFQCHSHEQKISAGLSLDSRSGWEQGGDSGPAVVPGSPDESLLIDMVQLEQMPPGAPLPDAEIQLLVDWVKQGAHDPRKLDLPKIDPLDWWSLRPLEKPALPAGDHPIDAFIHAKLVEQAIAPSVKADKRTLVRRLYYDLHGLLPTPEEVTAFLEYQQGDSWEQLVDQLLASPRYGERWGRHWLDVVHFADSHGCEHDVKRPHAWRYRDYVIDRLNADISWGTFIREQLAADVFAADEPQLTAALGFIAAGPLELSRAGTAPVTFDYLDRDDMVAQTMAAFASTTANCARCHSHKFDPITQEDYYALQAVFAGVGKGDIEFDVDLSTKKKREELNQLIAAAEQKDPAILLDGKYASAIQSWEAAWHELPVSWTTLSPEIYVATGGATLTKLDDEIIWAEGPVADQENYTVSSAIALKKLSAVRLEVLSDEQLPAGGPGRAGNGNLHLSEVDLNWFPATGAAAVKLDIASASADFDQDGWTSAHAIDGDLKSGWAIYPRVNESHEIIFRLAAPVDVSGGGKLAVTLKQHYPPKHVIGKFRISVTDSKQDSIVAFPKAALDALQKPAEQRTVTEATAIAAVALDHHARKELQHLPPKVVVYAASSSWSHAKNLGSPQPPKTVHLLRRGAIDAPVREVEPGALSILPGLGQRFEYADMALEAQRRAALADWLAHRDNPLTWRSIVNRVWHYHFGRGLCETPNDFGRMGSEPTHPELLDWLAVWFRDEANGSLKELHRLILTSETWQQSSFVAPKAKDADNRYLWKMKRKRLDAEAFRDSALSAAGRLDLTMKGPGIEQFGKSNGPQATPKLDYLAYDWNSQDSHRRSIYRVVWRGIPDPFMESLDFPDLGLLTPKRGFSVSALQSLALYNNDFVLHASEWLASRIQEESPEKKVARAVEVCWQRQPTPAEDAVLATFAEQHGLAALCRVLLNSNEFLFVD